MHDTEGVMDDQGDDWGAENTAAYIVTIRTAIRDLQSEVKTLARVDRLQTRKLLRLLNGTD